MAPPLFTSRPWASRSQMWSSPVSGRPPPEHAHTDTHYKHCEPNQHRGRCTDTLVLLTLGSSWDELNRKHDCATTANGVWTEMNLGQWASRGERREKIKADTETKGKKKDGEMGGRPSWRGSKTLRLRKSFVEIHSVSSSSFSCPRHKRHSSG